jgi:hypothetical protein
MDFGAKLNHPCASVKMHVLFESSDNKTQTAVFEFVKLE